MHRDLTLEYTQTDLAGDITGLWAWSGIT